MAPPQRYLIVNADDFGQSPGVNQGIAAAHEHGIVTSASLMVRWPAAADAAAYCQAHPALSLGRHVDLGEWAYHDAAWVPRYHVIPTDDIEASRTEVARQLAAFRRLTGKEATHIDSHQHVHHTEPVRSIMTDVARQLGVPLRHFSPGIRHCGRFYGQTAEGSSLPGLISVDGLIELLTDLPPGVTELGCHPGFAADLDTPYRTERAEEVKALCDPRARFTLTSMGILLRSFADVGILLGSFPDAPSIPIRVGSSGPPEDHGHAERFR